MAAMSVEVWTSPLAAITPNSVKWPRSALMAWVRWRTRRSRVRNTMAAACWFALLRATKRMVGRWAASQIASASALSFFCRLTNGFTYAGAISFTVWPSLTISRPQSWALAHASMATVQGGSVARNARSWPRRSFLRKTTRARAVGSVQLKDVLGEIQSDGAHLVHGRLLEWPATPSLWHTTAAGGVHTITAEPTRHRILLGMPGDLAIEHSNALVQRSELLDQYGQDPPRRLGQIGGGVLQDGDELGGMDRPFGGDHPELGQVTAERVDGLGALANQQVSRAKHNGCGLRLLTFHSHEAHGGALSGLADRLRIGHVILLPLDERLHVRRRDEADRVAELSDLTPPVVGARASLQGHRAGRERGEEREELAAAQLLAKDHRARAVGSVQLKDVLGEIQSDGAHLVHGRLLEWPATPSLWHTTAAGGVHTITAEPTRHRILLGMPGDLAIEHSNALVQRSELLDQYGQDP